MNRNILFLVISFLFCSYTYGQSHRESFMRALEAKDMVKAEEALKSWDFADSNDAELYVSYFNFYTLKSQDVGLIGTAGYDSKYSNKALEYITEGIERFPMRFDMRVAKIHMLGTLKEFTSFTSEVINMIEYSVKIDNNWKGEGFLSIEQPAEIFDGAITNFQGVLYKEKNPTLYNNVLQISTATLKHYPRHVQSMLNISTVYVRQNKYDNSLDILLKAIKIEPKNAILHYNIAYVYGLKGDRVNSKKYYESVVANATDKEGNLKEAAQRHLNELK